MSHRSALKPTTQFAALLWASAGLLMLLHAASCSLGADLDTGPIEAVQCKADEDCPVGSTCAGDGYCDPFPDPDNPVPPCAQTRCGRACVDLQTDPGHCGGCDVACPGAQACEAAACICPVDSTMCSGECVDLEADAAHCGSCDRACAATESCIDSTCGCLPSQTRCGSECVDTDTSRQHCGACDNACAGNNSVCEGGTCGCSSAAEAYCGSGCVSVTSNASNCGACGNACPGGAICDGGTCYCERRSNGEACPGSAAPGLASVSCSGRFCTATCDASAADCNGDILDGCEATPADCP